MSISDRTHTDGEVVARFTTTPAEFTEAVKALSSVLYGFGGVSRARGIAQRVKFFAIGGGLALAILAIGNAIALQPGGFTMRDFMVAVIVSTATAIGVMVGLAQFQMRRMRKALSRQPAQEDVEIIVEETGLWWNAETQKHFWLYSSFDRVIAFKDGYYLVTGLSGGFIPGRGFDGEAKKMAFEALLKEKLPIGATAQFFAAKAL